VSKKKAQETWDTAKETAKETVETAKEAVETVQEPVKVGPDMVNDHVQDTWAVQVPIPLQESIKEETVETVEEKVVDTAPPQIENPESMKVFQDTEKMLEKTVQHTEEMMAQTAEDTEDIIKKTILETQKMLSNIEDDIVPSENAVQESWDSSKDKAQQDEVQNVRNVEIVE